MNMATIVVSGVYAHARMYPTIPAGIVGAEVTFEFTDPIWEGLTKTAVFQGVVTRDVILSGSTAIIPAETVAKAGPMLKVGIYGVDAENNLVIPTLWAAIGGIRDAADPSGDPGTDPELPIWAQLADRVEGVTKDVEELKQTGGVGPGTPGAPGADGKDGGYYTPVVTQPDEDTIQFEFTPSKEGMPAIDPAQIELPAGPPGPQGSPGQPGRDGKDSVVAVTGATVGQTVKISAVDENGVPTAWEPTDFPSGVEAGGASFRLIGSAKITEPVNSMSIAIEDDGITEIYIVGKVLQEDDTQYKNILVAVNEKNASYNMAVSNTQENTLLYHGVLLEGGYYLFDSKFMTWLNNNQGMYLVIPQSGFDGFGDQIKNVAVRHANGGTFAVTTHFDVWGR